MSFIFPLIFIGVLGTSSQSNLGEAAGFDFLKFIFVGVLIQTLFQSSASGVISLVEDREHDFSQEMFVTPISRYSIILGKIVGESVVALIQAIGVILFGYLIGVDLSTIDYLKLIPIFILACLLGSSFGILVLANLSSQKAINQIFPIVIFPQFFLAGIFTPITNLPIYLKILSYMAPLTYIIDLARGVLYIGTAQYDKVVVNNPFFNLIAVIIMFVVFLVAGTYLFVRNERNR
jgi:ABC-2 type transport system permease protein